MPFNGRSYLGYDPASKKFFGVWVDNTGGYETVEFTGWQGDKLTFEGTVHMGTTVAKGRDTFVKGAKTLTHTFDLEEKGLLYHPHTSAGRQPTQQGLRFFVDAMLEVGAVDEAERSQIARQIETQHASLED